MAVAYGCHQLGILLVPVCNWTGTMSVLRLAIIASCAVAALPADKAQQARLYDGAVTAASWAATYCDREADKCEKAAVYWDQFKTKAQFAASIAVDTVQRYSAHAARTAPATQVAAPDARQAPIVVVEKVTVRNVPIPAPVPVEVPLVRGHGTLSGQDLQSPWRGNKQRKS